jgi:hypothetical protein
MIGRNVLHGDLSPNNLIIHEGRGFFIDFDHAQIIAQGSTSVRSNGTVSRDSTFNMTLTDLIVGRAPCRTCLFAFSMQ